MNILIFGVNICFFFIYKTIETFMHWTLTWFILSYMICCTIFFIMALDQAIGSTFPKIEIDLMF